ncbi:MAG: YncE family protein [Betaproteobacteria bacterium]
MRRAASRILLLAFAFALCAPGARGDSLTATLGGIPAFGVTLNAVTNKIYVTGSPFSAATGVTVIDGATLARASVMPGVSPSSVVVNPADNSVFVLAADSATVTRIDATTNETRTFPVGAGASAMAVNGTLGDLYVANTDDGTVTLINGVTRETITVAVGARPVAIAVNAATNRAYVANAGSDTVTVIDGASFATTTIPAGVAPSGVALNPVTNRIYVMNAGPTDAPGSVTVIEGATNAISTVAAGIAPRQIAVNPVTDKAYVLNHNGPATSTGSVTVIDGATKGVTHIAAGMDSRALLVNPTANKVYVANFGFAPGATCCLLPTGDITVIDGATNTASAVGANAVRNPSRLVLDPVTSQVYVQQDARWPGVGVVDGDTNAVRFSAVPDFAVGGIAVNPVTNRLYATQFLANEVFVVDASTNATLAIPVGARPVSVVVDPVNGKAYVANQDGNSVTILIGPTGGTMTIAVPSPTRLALNPATHKVYVTSATSPTLTIFDGITNGVSSVALPGVSPSVAVNVLSNKIYVSTSDGVLVLDGVTNAVRGLIPGVGGLLAVNPVTNLVYTAETKLTTVIDGAADAIVTRIPYPEPGSGNAFLPAAIAVDPMANQVYVARPVGSVVIDGATRAFGTVPAQASDVDVDVRANKAYFAAQSGVVVRDGASGAITTVASGTGFHAVAVNPVTHTVYASSAATNAVMVVDGAANATSTVSTGVNPGPLAVDGASGTVYVTNAGDNTVTAIVPSTTRLGRHGINVGFAGLNLTTAPPVNLSVCCAYAPRDPPVRTVYARLNDTVGPFARGIRNADGSFLAFAGFGLPGLNYFNAFALDAMDGTGIETNGLSTIGVPLHIAVVASAPAFTTSSPLARAFLGVPYRQRVSASGGDNNFTYALTDGALPAGISLSPDGILSGIPAEEGFFTFTVGAGSALGATARTFALTVVASDPVRDIGISTRVQVLTGDNVVIGGFAIGGAGARKTVVVRARGPSLAANGVSGTLANPVLQLFSGATLLGSNDDWLSDPNADAILASGFAPADGREAAMLVTLDSGLYTAVVSGAGGATGVGIVEIFELDHPEVPLVAISTRGLVQAADNVMIGGFIIAGSTPQTVIVRARGPSLARDGVGNPLGNPTLTLVGNGVTIANDDWADAPNAAGIQSSGFAPADARESAILVTLDPGAYTAIVSGVGGATGVGIVEVFAQ